MRIGGEIMIKVEIDLCEKAGERLGLCSPVMMISEDTSEDSFPIIFPENMAVGEAKQLTEEFKEKIIEEYETVEELRKELYEENESGE